MLLAPNLHVFRHRAYLHFWLMRVSIAAARQMEAVAIGWQVYNVARDPVADGGLGWGIEESALLLGLIGLTQFVPVLLLSLVGGQAADRLNRKMILIASNTVRVLVSFALLASVFLPASYALPIIFSVAGTLGCVNAFTPAAANSLFPQLVPRDELPNAIAWNSLGFQTATITGPAIGGLLYAAGGAEAVYITAIVLSIFSIAAIATANTPKHEKLANARGWSMVFEGLGYIRRNKIVLGAISLDLVVVFFGGAKALLPVFARDILFVGSVGLGLLQAAVAVGAVSVAFVLATRPLARRVGAWMMWAVGIYGAATLVFGLSQMFWLSFAALAVTGAADEISVYVRASLIQLATPDKMKGRVSSVSFIFISASNELGEFESGVAARLLGPVGAVVFGGCAAIATALLWTRLFPELAKADRFDRIEEQAVEPTGSAST
ncbi:MFS transporter [Henriciella litoralis]|uniref:MFS transporter n=1 Tax=Henriciella litoralis TaxID=568102 RepID=UPI000A03F1AF|nr:MFS transporter [Henriciella litoralis]